jgi:hypothetical protein
MLANVEIIENPKESIDRTAINRYYYLILKGYTIINNIILYVAY